MRIYERMIFLLLFLILSTGALSTGCSSEVVMTKQNVEQLINTAQRVLGESDEMLKEAESIQQRYADRLIIFREARKSIGNFIDGHDLFINQIFLVPATGEVKVAQERYMAAMQDRMLGLQSLQDYLDSQSPAEYKVYQDKLMEAQAKWAQAETLAQRLLGELP